MTSHYPDPASPRRDRELLELLSYDPYKMMPQAFPRHPHLFVTADQLKLVRTRIKRGGWWKISWERLLDACLDKNNAAAAPLGDTPTTERKLELAHLALRNALACCLFPDRDRHDLALRALRRVANFCLRQPQDKPRLLFTTNDLAESRGVAAAAIAYDLLAGMELSEKDDRLFRDMLRAAYKACDACNHYTCGNFNTWSQTGRLTVALALQDPQGVHDALYGCSGGAEWRYGLIHQFRHDVLADGMHWERTPGYHFYTLMGFVYALDALNNSGCDLWHYQFPTLMQDDLKDNHRAYGPAGRRTMQAAFDAPFRLAFGNGDLSLLSDSGLGNLRGAWIWGIVYNKAYEAYRQPHYTWLLNKMEKDYTKRDIPGLPMPLQSHHGVIDFVRLKDESYPAGNFSFGGAGPVIGVNGLLKRASSLFPSFGGAVLRASAGSKAPAAYIYYGPHVAGHQHPAALHADIHISGSRLTDAPRCGGYTDNRYLTWARATVASNTIVVDGKSMFPYDFPTNSIWECDRWRDNISDGELKLFQVERDFSAARAINVNVYPGVTLDRTLVVSGQGVLDVYRVDARKSRRLEYIFHTVGAPEAPAAAKPVSLGKDRGYMHLSKAKAWPADKGAAFIWEAEHGVTAQCIFAPQPGATMIRASDPELAPTALAFGELKNVTSRTTLMMRLHGKKAIFASFWTTGANAIKLRRLKDGPGNELRFAVTNGAATTTWSLPAEGNILRRGNK